MEDDFVCRHHVELRVQLCVRKEETFPTPQKYIDVTRTTHTNLEVLQESHVDDSWNVDVDRNLSDAWTGYTKFTSLSEQNSERTCVVRERPTTIQATDGPDYVWPDIWPVMSKAAQKMEKHQWAFEKPKLADARKLRAISFHRSR